MSKAPDKSRVSDRAAAGQPLSNADSADGLSAKVSDLPEPWMYVVTIVVAALAGVLIFWVQW